MIYLSRYRHMAVYAQASQGVPSEYGQRQQESSLTQFIFDKSHNRQLKSSSRILLFVATDLTPPDASCPLLRALKRRQHNQVLRQFFKSEAAILRGKEMATVQCPTRPVYANYKWLYKYITPPHPTHSFVLLTCYSLTRSIVNHTHLIAFTEDDSSH